MKILGDLTVFDDTLAPPAPVPGKLAKAFAVIAEHLHPRIAIEGMRSKNQCILCALTVRDFLWDIGFADARALSCVFMVTAFDGDELVHSLGIGKSHDGKPEPGKWCGHLAVALPGTGWLIDPTLFQAVRSQWPMVSGMGAAPMFVERIPKRERIVSGLTYQNGIRRVSAAWWSSPWNLEWQNAPDSIAERRAPVVSFLTSAFGRWHENNDRGASRDDASSGAGPFQPNNPPGTRRAHHLGGGK